MILSAAPCVLNDVCSCIKIYTHNQDVVIIIESHQQMRLQMAMVNFESIASNFYTQCVQLVEIVSSVMKSENLL